MPDNNITNPIYQDRGLGELTSALGGQITHMSSDFAVQPQVVPFSSDSAYNPNLSPTAARMRVDNHPDLFNKNRNTIDLSWATQKAPTWEGQSYRPDDFREELHSGEYVQKYGAAYIGVDNAERLGERDSDTFGRYFTRAAQKTTSAILGTIGTLPSLVFGASQGSYESTYNNSFTRMLEDWDKQTETNNQVYYTQAQQKSFWGKGGLDFVGSTLETAAFTVGTLAGELAMTALTGGGYAPVAAGKLALKFGSRIPKILRAADAVSDVGRAVSGPMSSLNRVLGAERVAGAVTTFNRGSNLVKNLNTARFLFTSGAFEAGVETNTYKKIAENNYWDEMDRLGKQPSNEEVKEFYDKLEESALGVNVANHVILGISNAALFGSLVGLGGTFKTVGKAWGNSTLLAGAEAKLLGKGTTEVTKGVFKGLTPNLAQKSANFTLQIGKGFLTEGVWEEGHQGIAQKMATHYVKTAYDKDQTKKTFDIFDSYLKSGEEQFGTSEGMKEVIMGGIIGGVFHSIGAVKRQIKGNTQAARNEAFAKVQNNTSEIADLLSKTAYTREDLAAKFQNLNRQLATDEYVSEVLGENNPLHGDLALTQKIIAGMEQAYKVGKEDYFNDVMNNSVFQLDNNKLQTELGLNEQEAEEYKNTIADQLTQVRKSYKKNRQFADTLFPDRNFEIEELGGQKAGALSDVLAQVLTMGDVSQKTAANIHQATQRRASELGPLTEKDRVTLDIFSALGTVQGNLNSSVFVKLALRIPELEEKKKELEKSLVNLGLAQNSLAKKEAKPELAEELDSQIDDKLSAREEAIQGLEELDAEIEDHKQRLEVIGKALLGNFYNNLGIQKDVSVLDLIDYRKSLEELSEKTKVLHPADARKFTELMTTLQTAMNINDDFQLLAQSMLNPETMFSTAKNILSGKPKPMSEQTIEAFVNAANSKWLGIEEEWSANSAVEDEEEEETEERTNILQENDLFFPLDSEGNKILQEGEPVSFETEAEARDYQEDMAVPQEVLDIEEQEPVIEDQPIKPEVLEKVGDNELIKNEGTESGWSIVNTQTGETTSFEELEKAREAMASLTESFSITEDLDNEEEENDDTEYEVVVNDKKDLDYKPEGKRYRITIADIKAVITAIRTTEYGASLDVSTILQSYDNVYISEAKEKNEEEYYEDEMEEGYEVVGTNIHHLHFSSLFKMITKKGGKVTNSLGLPMTVKEARELDEEKYGWKGVSVQLPGSNDRVKLYRAMGAPYITIKEDSIKIKGKKINTTSDGFFELLTGNKVVEQSGGNTTYKIAYSLDNSGSIYEPLKSNFTHPMGNPSAAAAKTLSRKDEITFEYDENLPFNQQIKTKNTQTYFKNAVIVVKHKGKVIGYLKVAGRSDEALLALRKSVILEKENNPEADAPTATLKMVLPGSLKLSLNLKGEVNWTTIKKRQNDAQIITYGFVECERMKKSGKPENRYTTQDKAIKRLTLTHMKDISKNLKTGERAYFAVIMHAGRRVAIPIKTSEKVKGSQGTNEFKELLNNLTSITEQSLSKMDVKRVNKLILEHNKKNPKKTIPEIKDLETLKNRLKEYKEKRGSLYNKTGANIDNVWEALDKVEKSVPVALDNKSVFHSPKPVIDFTTFSIRKATPRNKVSKTKQAKIDKSDKNCP